MTRDPELVLRSDGVWCDAAFSEDRRYRFALWRFFDLSPRILNMVCLNWSRASEMDDDITVTKGVHFARAWGYGGFTMTNIFGMGSTDPKALRRATDPVGAGNDAWIAREAEVGEPCSEPVEGMCWCSAHWTEWLNRERTIQRWLGREQAA